MDMQLVFPPCLTPRQRAVIHALGEAHSLPHVSAGDGDARHVALGAGRRVAVPPPPGGAPLDDAELCRLLREHLRLDAEAAFAAEPPAGRGKPAPRAGGARGKQQQPSAAEPLSVEDFVARAAPLLELERAAEVAAAEEELSALSPEAAQARGRTLANLRLDGAEGGLLGRTLLTLVPNKGGPGAPLPPHRFAPHDVVRLRAARGGAAAPTLAEGVVYRVRDAHIVVAVDDVPDGADDDGDGGGGGGGLGVPLRLEKLANEVTYARLAAALRALGAAGRGGAAAPAAPLLEVCFGRRAPRFRSPPPAWAPVNPGLDASQRRAVTLALAAADVALIHGPPGTGKTTAVVELILQEAARGARVLACAASNVAVDNLAERLSGARPPGSAKPLAVVRVGHPARLSPAVVAASLEARVLASDSSALARDCRREIKALNARLLKLTARRDRDERRAARGELRALAREERARQARALGEVLAAARVVCATLTGLGSRQLDGQEFDVVVIDEAAQATEPACWAALLRARRAVLAGDHRQLPPTVVSRAAADGGLARTLFERLHAMWGSSSGETGGGAAAVDAPGAENGGGGASAGGPEAEAGEAGGAPPPPALPSGASEMLTVQYRMHADISGWASAEMYGGRLAPHPSVAGHTLAGLKGVATSAGGELPVLLLIDTAGCDMPERRADGADPAAGGASTGSTLNEGEAEVAMAHVRALLAAGLAPADVGVIAPYSAQVGLLRELRAAAGLPPELEVATVDGFQGREKEAIVISATRSNDRKEVGFLAEPRRMNVAVTRARRHACLVCDSETLGGDPFLARLVEWFSAHGDYRSADEVLGR